MIHNTDKNVKVDIDLPVGYQLPEEKQIVVYYVSKDDRLEASTTILHKRDDGTQYVTFETNHFSVYAIAEVEIPKPTPEPTTELTPEPTKAPMVDVTKEPVVNAFAGEENTGGDGTITQKEEGQESALTGNVMNYSVLVGWIGVPVVIILVVVCVVVMRKEK